MNRDFGWQLVNEHVKDRGLIRHMQSVEAAMRWYARQLGQDEENWGLVGLIHDIEEGRRPLDWATLDALMTAVPRQGSAA